MHSESCSQTVLVSAPRPELDERTARLQAAGIGTFDASLSSAEERAGGGAASPAEGTGRQTNAVRVSPADGVIGAGRDNSQQQTSVPTVSGRRISHEDPAASVDSLDRCGE